MRLTYEPASEPQVQYIDFRVEKGGRFEHKLAPELATAICYVYKGAGKFGPDAVTCGEGDTLLLSRSGSVAFSADEEVMHCFWRKNVPDECCTITSIQG